MHSIPEELISLATLKYLGYNDEKATEIWIKWTAQAPGDPVPESIPGPPFELRFIDYVVGYLYGRPYEFDADEDDDGKWHEVMDRCGINQSTQRAIMDPVFRQVRLTETCQYWIRNTVELRYEALEQVREASRGNHHGILGGGVDQPSISEPRDTAMSETALHSANSPGCFTLYRGMDKPSLKNLFDKDGNLANIQKLISHFTTDFCGGESAYCFVVDRDIAMRYASFVKRRSEATPVVIVQATFQNSTLVGLTDGEIQRVHWPSEEWKRLVFLSHKVKGLPHDMRKYGRASLIIGTKAGKPNTVFGKLRSYAEITERMVYKSAAERYAVQYVFRREEGEKLLEKAEIKVFSITDEEFSQWYENN